MEKIIQRYMFYKKTIDKKNKKMYIESYIKIVRN